MDNTNKIEKTTLDGAKCTFILDKGVQKLHSFDDKPAWEKGGEKKWFNMGYISRDIESGPAIVYPNGDYSFMVNGLLHNPNGPAQVKNGKERHFINGLLQNNI